MLAVIYHNQSTVQLFWENIFFLKKSLTSNFSCKELYPSAFLYCLVLNIQQICLNQGKSTNGPSYS